MLWVKALHVISVIAWMAALLYLPRLIVYHADSAVGLGAVGDLQGHGAAAALRRSPIPAMIADLGLRAVDGRG